MNNIIELGENNGQEKFINNNNEILKSKENKTMHDKLLELIDNDETSEFSEYSDALSEFISNDEILKFINQNNDEYCDIIGTLNIYTNSGVIVGPQTDFTLIEKNKIMIGNELQYELIPNLKKGKWKIASLSVNTENDVHIIYYNKTPTNKNGITHKIIPALRTNGNCIGFYPVNKKYPSVYTIDPDMPREGHIISEMGITINVLDKDFMIFGMPVSVIISEYNGKVFRIVIIR